MTARAIADTKGFSTTLPNRMDPASGVLQRKCACGGKSGLTGQCPECRRQADLGGTLQTKLRVGPTNDRFEREADRVADQVVSSRESQLDPRVTPLERRGVQRQEEEEEEQIQAMQRQPLEEEEEELQAMQRQPLEEEEEEMMPKSLPQTGGKAARTSHAPPVVHEVLRAQGRPLDPSTRGFMEARFGHDFGRVRIHSGSRPADSARDVNARAYTVGRHIVFGAGEYSPATRSGQRLLAHELTHVVQQSGGRAPSGRRGR